MAKLKKPKSVKSSKIKSDKWDEITKDRDFKESDIPTLTLLCQWHLVAETCISDMDEVDNQLVYTNNLEFWSSDNLTGNQTGAYLGMNAWLFWSSDNLTGNQTRFDL